MKEETKENIQMAVIGVGIFVVIGVVAQIGIFLMWLCDAVGMKM